MLLFCYCWISRDLDTVGLASLAFILCYCIPLELFESLLIFSQKFKISILEIYSKYFFVIVFISQKNGSIILMLKLLLCSQALSDLDSLSSIDVLSGIREPSLLLHLVEECRNFLFSRSAPFSCQRQQLSLEPDTLNSFSSITQDLLPWFVTVTTNPLFFYCSSDTSHICLLPSVPLLRVLNPSSVSTLSLSRV